MQNTRQTYCQSQVIWFQVLLFINLSGHLHHSDFIFVFHVQNYTQEHRSGDQKNSQDNQKVVETTLPSCFVNHWKIKEQENMHISLHESWRLKKLTKIKKKMFYTGVKNSPKAEQLECSLTTSLWLWWHSVFNSWTHHRGTCLVWVSTKSRVLGRIQYRTWGLGSLQNNKKLKYFDKEIKQHDFWCQCIIFPKTKIKKR